MFVCRGVLAVAALACLAYGVNGCGDFQNLHTIDPSEITTLKSENFDTLNLLGPKTCIAVLSSATPVRMWVHDVTVSPTDTIQLSYTDGGTQVVDLVALWTSGDSILIAPQETTFSVVLSVTSVTVPSRLAVSFVGTSPIPACSSQLQPTSTPAYLELPSFPSSYQQNSNCYWEMTTVFDFIRFEIQWLDLDQLAGACGENLFITNGLYGAQSFGNIANLCEDKQLYMENAMTFRSSGNQANVFFSADNNNIVGTGFRIRYWAESDPVNTEPTVTGICTYTPADEALPENGGELLVEITGIPGVEGLDSITVVDYDPATGHFIIPNPTCAYDNTLNIDGEMKINQRIDVTTTTPLAGTPQLGTCPLSPLTNDTDGNEVFCFYTLARQNPVLIVGGDAVFPVCCNPLYTTAEETESPIINIILPEYEVPDLMPAFYELVVIDAVTGEPLIGEQLPGKLAMLRFIMEDAFWEDGKPIGVRLYNCDVRGYQDRLANPGQLTIPMYDENGCPATGQPGFEVNIPFFPDDGFPGYKIDYTAGPGVKYVSVSDAFQLAMFPETTELIFECYLDFCYDEACLMPTCLERKRRSIEYEEDGIPVTAAVIMQKAPFVIFQAEETQEPPTKQTTEECFQSWVFIVVVIILVLLLALAVTVSICLVHQLVKNKNNLQKDIH